MMNEEELKLEYILVFSLSLIIDRFKYDSKRLKNCFIIGWLYQDFYH